MSGLMDILLALVKVLCGGGSTTDEQPSPDLQKPHVERPQQQQPTSVGARPEHRPPAPQHRQEQQASKPTPQPRHEQVPKPTPPARQEAHPTPRHDARPHEVSPAPESLCLSERDSLPQDQNQINQHEEHYVALRAKASEHGDLMARCFQESHEAYSRGEGARAKEFSEQGKQHERTMEKLNAEASAWVFRENNKESKVGEIDLHGLYVKEAISYSENALQEARQRGDAEVRLIVGKGLHSDNHIAKIKPAIEDLMKKHSIPTEVDPLNAGVLIARLR